MLEFLHEFVEKANASGRLNYDYALELFENVDDTSVRVVCYDSDLDEEDRLTDALVGTLRYIPGSPHDLMGWKEDGTDNEIQFSPYPWVLVSITYAGP